MPLPTLTKTRFDELWQASVPLWQEDDAAPDAESLEAACGRFWPHETWKRPLLKEDLGDAIITAYQYGNMVIFRHSSYRSNNSIHVAKLERGEFYGPMGTPSD